MKCCEINSKIQQEVQTPSEWMNIINNSDSGKKKRALNSKFKNSSENESENEIDDEYEM